MAGIVFTKVRKDFGSFVAVKDLDLEIGAGEFVSLLGPSGCGKTTTLRMLAGLEFPTAGTISIGGRVVNDVAPGKRNVAMVFQSYALYPHMTVGENIAYPLRKQGVARAEREARVRTVAETLQLGALLDRRPKQLSGGQQQRVALGRALVREPAAFLLDEPLSNLDAKLRAHMRAELIELHRRVGKTFVYVTHDQLEAMTMSDRIAVMHEGALQQFAPPRVIYDQPSNLMVAGFIGSPAMNVMDAELQATAGGAVATNGLVRAPLAGAPDSTSGARAVKLGVRPEDVLLGAGPLRGRIRVVEPTGHETIVAFEAAGASFVARATADFSAAPGDDIAFDLRPGRLHVFEAAGGRRLDLSGAGPIAAV